MIIRNDMDVSYVRAFHACPGAPPVNIYINGELIFKDISFKNFSEYVQLPKGEYKVEVFASRQKGNPMITQDIRVPEKDVITIAVSGNLQDLQLVPYVEGNAGDLHENKTRLRIIHLSPDDPAVDVLIDQDSVFKNVGFLDETDYEQLLSGSYNITLNIAGTNDIVLILKIDLKGKKVYTVYVVGNPPYLSAILSLDGSTFVRFP